jgi:hypothetical protein
MTVICCAVCQSDPAGRWKQPSTMIFIDGQSTDGSQYRCRDHVSPAKDEKLKARERELGLPPGGLR